MNGGPRPWHLWLLEWLSVNFTLVCLAVLALTGRGRCVRQWGLGCVCGALGELWVAKSGTLVWEYHQWRSHFIYPPTAVVMMWGLWSALFAELSAGCTPRSLVGLSVREAVHAVLLAASIEPLAVRLGWWEYSAFPYQGLKVQQVPVSVHAAYFFAFATLSGCSRFWEHRMPPQQSWASAAGGMLLSGLCALPIGFVGFQCYVLAATLAGDFWAIRLVAFTLFLMTEHLTQLAVTPAKPDMTTVMMCTVMVIAVHGYCCAVGYLELRDLQYCLFAAAMLLIHCIYLLTCQKQLWLYLSQTRCAECLTPVVHIAEGASLAVEGTIQVSTTFI